MNIFLSFYSETDSDDSVNGSESQVNPKLRKSPSTKTKSASPKKSPNKVKVEFKPQASTSTTVINPTIVPSENIVQKEIVQEVKLEDVQEVVAPVVVQAPDHQGYTETQSQPEEKGYYNFSLELLKSFTERFKGQVSIDGLLMSPLKFFKISILSSHLKEKRINF